MRVEQRVHQQEQDSEQGRSAIARKFTAKKISKNNSRGSESEHRQSRGRDRIAGHSPDQREISHHAGWMGIGHGGVRDPRAVAQDVERGRNELAEFVPEKRQSEVGNMQEKNEQRERGKQRECAEADRPHHIE